MQKIVDFIVNLLACVILSFIFALISVFLLTIPFIALVYPKILDDRSKKEKAFEFSKN